MAFSMSLASPMLLNLWRACCTSGGLVTGINPLWVPSDDPEAGKMAMLAGQREKP